MPLGFHEGFGPYLPQVGDRFGADLQMVHTACHPMEMMLAVISMIGGGVLEHHPNLRVAFLEGNCGWVPFLLWRLDEHYEVTFRRAKPTLTLKPSEYFRRQCFVSVEADEDFVKQVIDYMGDDTIVFSTDWPHGDSKYPHARGVGPRLLPTLRSRSGRASLRAFLRPELRHVSDPLCKRRRTE